MSSNTQSFCQEKGQSEEAQYIRKKESDNEQKSKGQEQIPSSEQIGSLDRDFEGGFGGQEDLEDRYATTSGEH